MDWREIKRCQGRRRRHCVTVSGCDVAVESLARDVETAVGQPAQRLSRVAPAEPRMFGAGAPDSTLIEAFLAPVARPGHAPLSSLASRRCLLETKVTADLPAVGSGPCKSARGTYRSGGSKRRTGERR